MKQLPSSVLITGASSGLGRALALAYAAPGVTLFLQGRNEQRLKEVGQGCCIQGAKTHITCLDVTDTEAVKNWVMASEALCPLEMVIANAGISAGTAGGGEGEAQRRAIFATNIDGVLSTLHAALSFMQQRKRGQLVIISSLAGYRGLPGAPSYSASKAAVRVYGEALRGSVWKEHIGVTVVTPGYIRTPMTDVNSFPMPFIMSAERAARLIQRKLRKNPARIAFPLPMYFILWLLSSLPPGVTDWLFSRLPAKTAQNTDT